MAEPTATGTVSSRALMAAAGWATLGIAAVVAIALVAIAVLADDSRDPSYRRAQADSRSIGPSTGRLDDGTRVGAVTFFDEDGAVCTVFGPPGDRGDELYCVNDTPEEVDAINWEVDTEANVDLTVMIVDGSRPEIDLVFDGPTPGHAQGRFPIAGPAVVAVYVGPPWEGLDVVTEPDD